MRAERREEHRQAGRAPAAAPVEAGALSRASTAAPPMGPDFLTVAEVAARLRCSARHVRDLCAEGKLPARFDGKRWLVSAPAFERVVQLLHREAEAHLDADIAIRLNELRRRLGAG